MFTRHYHVSALSRFKTHWKFSPGSPGQWINWTVRGETIAYELSFDAALTVDQRRDAVRYFESAAFRHDQQERRAKFVGLFARRADLARLAWAA